MQRYDVGNGICWLSEHEEGDYYLVEEVDAEIAALKEDVVNQRAAKLEAEGNWRRADLIVKDMEVENTALREALKNVDEELHAHHSSANDARRMIRIDMEWKLCPFREALGQKETP